MTLEIVDPRAGAKSGAGTEGRLGLASLARTPVAVIDNSKPRFDVFVAALLGELSSRYEATVGLRYAKPNAANGAPEEWFDNIRAQGGAAIAGWGD